MKTSWVEFALLLAPSLCGAQGTDDPLCPADVLNQAVGSLIVEESIGAALRNARLCLEQQDTGCAAAELEALEGVELSADAEGALALISGDIDTLNNRLLAAQITYERAAESPELHLQIRRGATARLAILYLRQAKYQQILDQLAGLSCDERTSEMSFLEANGDFGVGDYQRALTNVETAIDAETVAGRPVPETWRELRDASVEAMAAIAEGEICVDETPLGSHIPVERCYTVEEFLMTGDCSRTQRSEQTINSIMECRVQ